LLKNVTLLALEGMRGMILFKVMRHLEETLSVDNFNYSIIPHVGNLKEQGKLLAVYSI